MLSNGPSGLNDLNGLDSGDWKLKHHSGIISLTDDALKRLINTEPIEKVYIVDPDPIARGQFATVYRCHHRVTGDEVAAKFSTRWRMGADCSADIVHEIAVCALLRKAHRVVRLLDVFNTDSEIILVMEYAPGGDLQTLLDEDLVPYERNVISFLRQLLEGLVYIHDRNIVHLDIKPQNLVLMSDFPDCSVKLCDFEISRMLTPGQDVREILGTADYVAPEIIHYEPITTKTDMWSFGVLTYVLLTGFLPFGGDNDQETFLEITRGELDFPEELFEDISEHAIDFIKRLLIRQPHLRLSAKECLEHEWITSDLKKAKLSPSTIYMNNLNSSTTSSPAVNANLNQQASLFNSNLYSSTITTSLPASTSHPTSHPSSHPPNLNDIELSLEKAFEILDGNSCLSRVPKVSSPINMTPAVCTPVNSSPRDTGLPPLYPYMTSRTCPSIHSSNSSLNRGSSRQSLDRLRSMSKSREVLAERLQLSCQKKALSKSRERLFDGRYGLYRSRDRLFDQRSFSHSVETLPPFEWMNNEDFLYNSNSSVNMPMLPIISMLPIFDDNLLNNRHYQSMASIDRFNRSTNHSVSSPKCNYFNSKVTHYGNEHNQLDHCCKGTKRLEERANEVQSICSKNYHLYDRNKNRSGITKTNNNSEKLLCRSRTEPSIPKSSRIDKSKKDIQKRRKDKDRVKQNKSKLQKVPNENKAPKSKDGTSTKSTGEKRRTSISHTEQRILERHERMVEKQEMADKGKRKGPTITSKSVPGPNRRHSMNENLKSENNARRNSRTKDLKIKRQKSFPVAKTKTNNEPLSSIEGSSCSSMESVKEFNNNITNINSRVIKTPLRKDPCKPGHPNISKNLRAKETITSQNKKNIQKTSSASQILCQKKNIPLDRCETFVSIDDSCDDGIFSRSNSMDSNTSVGSSGTVKAVEIPKMSARILESTLEKLKISDNTEKKSKSDGGSITGKDIKIVITEPKSIPDIKPKTVETPIENLSTEDEINETDSTNHDLTIIAEEEETCSSIPSYGRSISSNSSDIGSMISESSEPQLSNEEALKATRKVFVETPKTHSLTRDRSLGVLNQPLAGFKLSRSNSIHLDSPLMGKARPWGEVCNGSVSRAFQMFSQKSVEITVVGRKSSDPTSDRP